MLKKRNLYILSLVFIFTLNIFSSAHGHPKCEEENAVYLPSQNQKNADIAGIQRELKKLGYYNGPISAIYDKDTSKAVILFQAGNVLPANGIFDEKTRSKLISYTEGQQQKIIVPKGEISLRVNLDEKTLYLLADGKVFAVYPVAVGRNNASPVGEWTIKEKTYQPGGPYGSRWMALSCNWASYGIHGTNQPWSIGGAHSRGCIRMLNHEVAEIFDYVKIGTKVKIVGIPYSPFYEERNQLGLGSRGSDVVLVQQKLREHGYFRGTVDGHFKEETSKALKKFQKEHSFEANGLVTADIYPALGL